MPKMVQLLRRDPETLTDEELAIFKAVFGDDVEFVRTDPADFEEHYRTSVDFDNAPALLPMDKPIPHKAMEAGIPQLVFMPKSDGGFQLMQLTAVNPVFKPFTGEK